MPTSDQSAGRRKLKACETPGCSTNCTYAYSCHDERMGRVNVIFWPLVSLAVLGIVAGIANILA